MRAAIAAVLVAAACGPSAGTDEACTREGISTSGTLVHLGQQECSPCDLDTAYVLITLETTCEAGVEWPGPFRLVDRTTAMNLATRERFAFEDPLYAPAEQLWRVTPDEPIEWPGPSVDEVVKEPGDYSFRIELLYDLTAVELEGRVE